MLRFRSLGGREAAVMRSPIGLVMAAAMGAASAWAQSGPAKPPAVSAQAVGEEALALFERICLAALARQVPPETVAAEALVESPRIPPERLRANEAARETAGWRVRGATASFTLMLLEPGTQCAVYAEGVDPAAFLDGAERLMLGAEVLPGWLRQGQPQHSASPRPFGMLSFRRARYVPGGKAPPAARMAHVVASAADRRDGRPNTAVISVGIDTAPQPKRMAAVKSAGARDPDPGRRCLGGPR